MRRPGCGVLGCGFAFGLGAALLVAGVYLLVAAAFISAAEGFVQAYPGAAGAGRQLVEWALGLRQAGTGDLELEPLGDEDMAPAGPAFEASPAQAACRIDSWPAPGYHTVTQPFIPGAHRGIDIAAPMGAPIVSPIAGRVVFAAMGENGGYGGLVIVDGEGPRAGIRVYLAHLSRIDVRVGNRLAAGDRVGLAGSTGRSTGPHLHFETRINGAPVDPLGCGG